jgi:hypothetical protein
MPEFTLDALGSGAARVERPAGDVELRCVRDRRGARAELPGEARSGQEDLGTGSWAFLVIAACVGTNGDCGFTSLTATAE